MSHKATWRELFVPSSARSRESSCLAMAMVAPLLPCPRLALCSLVISFFVAGMGKGAKIRVEHFHFLYRLLHPWLPSETCIKYCSQVLLILDVLATFSAEQWFSVQTKQYTKYENTDGYKVTILYCILLGIEHFLSSDFRVPLKLMRVETSEHLCGVQAISMHNRKKMQILKYSQQPQYSLVKNSICPGINLCLCHPGQPGWLVYIWKVEISPGLSSHGAVYKASDIMYSLCDQVKQVCDCYFLYLSALKTLQW